MEYIPVNALNVVCWCVAFGYGQYKVILYYHMHLLVLHLTLNIVMVLLPFSCCNKLLPFYVLTPANVGPHAKY